MYTWPKEVHAYFGKDSLAVGATQELTARGSRNGSSCPGWAYSREATTKPAATSSAPSNECWLQASGDETLRCSALARRVAEQAVRSTYTPASRTYLRPMLVLQAVLKTRQACVQSPQLATTPLFLILPHATHTLGKHTVRRG